MTTFLDGLLSPLITQAGNARASYNSGQQQAEKDRAAQTMQLLQLKRQQDQDALKTALDQRTLRTPVLGDPNYAKAQGDVAGAQALAKVPAAVDEANQLSPITTRTQVNTAKALTPIKVAEQDALTPGAVSRAAQTEGAVAPIKTMQAVATERAVSPIKTAQAIATAEGETPTMVDRAAQIAAGKNKVGTLAAPMAAKVGQFGEMLKKAHDLMPSMDALDVKLGSSAAQDIASKGLGVGGLHIPGTTGIGSMMLNRTPEYAQYQAALSPFILAAAHALSGARINNEQIEQIRSSIEMKPGDTPQVRAQKKKNVVDLMNSIGGSLPQDAIGEQEGQMTPGEIAVLQGYGYRGSKGGSKGAAGPAASPAAASANRAQQLWDAAVAKHGEATVLREFGPRPPE